MNFWIHFWTVFFFASIAVFAALVVIIAIGGFSDIKSLIKNLLTAHQAKDVDEENKRIKI